MYEEQLMQNENILTESDNGQITLTTHRLRYDNSVFSKAKIVSIMLENISSIEVDYKSWFLMLILAIIGGAMGVAMSVMGANEQASDLQTAGFIILVFAVIFLLIYLFSRRHVVSVASKGGAKIVFFTKRIGRGSVIEFIDKIEKAQNERVMQTQGFLTKQ
jgi:hypothetical protein